MMIIRDGLGRPLSESEIEQMEVDECWLDMTGQNFGQDEGEVEAEYLNCHRIQKHMGKSGAA